MHGGSASHRLDISRTPASQIKKLELPALLTLRSLLIRDDSTKHRQEVKQIVWDTWPDRGVPPADESLCELLRMVIARRTRG